MQGTKRIAEVARIVDSTRYAIEQWISRKQFLSSIEVVPGQVREWTFQETLRLAVFARLVELGMNPSDAGKATPQYVHGRNDGVAYLVAWSGSATLALDPPEKVRVPGVVGRDIVNSAQLAELLSNSDNRAFLIVCLDAVAKDVSAAWGEQDSAG